MARQREEDAAGGPALRMGPLQKMNVRAEELATRFERLLEPRPSYCPEG